MKTIFDDNTRNELRERIKILDVNSERRWGKMNVSQMAQHNSYWNGWMLGKSQHCYKQEFLGKIFGKMALRNMIKDEKPFDKNIPTSDQFKAKKTRR